MTSKFHLDSPRAERLRRMVTIWKTDQPTDADVSSAFRRWSAQGTADRKWRPLGSAMAVALGSVATLAVVGWLDALHREPDAHTLTPSAEGWRSNSSEPATNAVGGVRRSESYLQRGRRRIAVRDGMRAELDANELAVVVVSGVRTELVGPGVVQLRADPGAPGGWVTSFDRWKAEEKSPGDDSERPARSRPTSKRSPRRAVAEAADAAGTDTSSGAWARVAQALRDHDSAKAEKALDELARSTDQKTRDAAELARAQLRVAEGRGTARGTLERLAASGATPAIRRRASELLEQSE